MSRFGPSRIGSVAAWTGAAVAWAATLVSGVLQPPTPVETQPPPDRPTATVGSETRAPLPSLPARGIMILRSAAEPAPAALASRPAAPPTTAPLATVAPPQPQSSGS
jgi:hypothetical protein